MMIKAWHFLPDDGRVKRLGIVPEIGMTITHKGGVVIRHKGLHASRRALDALYYAEGTICCLVEVWGDVQEEEDKLCGRNRVVLAKFDATRLLHEFALEIIEEALNDEKYDVDMVVWNALKIKGRWLDGKVTDQELDRARELVEIYRDKVDTQLMYAAHWAVSKYPIDAVIETIESLSVGFRSNFTEYNTRLEAKLNGVIDKC